MTSIATRVVGTGTCGDTGASGAGTSVSTQGLRGIVYDASKNRVVFQAAAAGAQGGGYLREYDIAAGTTKVIAGTGAIGSTGDGGAATAATLGYVEQIGIDGSFNLYLADSAFGVVRKIASATGIITTVAGVAISVFPPPPPSGDGGPATSAVLGSVFGLAVKPDGSFFTSNPMQGICVFDVFLMRCVFDACVLCV